MLGLSSAPEARHTIAGCGCRADPRMILCQDRPEADPNCCAAPWLCSPYQTVDLVENFKKRPVSCKPPLRRCAVRQQASTCNACHTLLSSG